MNNHNYPRRLLDDAIDRAVHELMGAEPRPGFRRRVLGKLNAPEARRSWIPALVIPAGALAAALMIAMWWRPAPTSQGGPATAAVVERAPQAPAAASTEQPAPENLASADQKREPPRRTGAREVSVPFTFGSPTDRVAATTVSPAAGDVATPAPKTSPAGVEPPLRQIPPLIQPSEIPLRPIELKDIIMRIPPRLFP